MGDLYKYQSQNWNSIMYFSYCIESKDFIYVFSNCSCKKKKVHVVQLYFTSIPFHVPSGRGGISVSELVHWMIRVRITLLTFHLSFFLFELICLFHWFENQYFCCCFKIVLLMLFNNKYTIHIYIEVKMDLRWIMVLT